MKWLDRLDDLRTYYRDESFVSKVHKGDKRTMKVWLNYEDVDRLIEIAERAEFLYNKYDDKYCVICGSEAPPRYDMVHEADCPYSDEWRKE